MLTDKEQQSIEFTLQKTYKNHKTQYEVCFTCYSWCSLTEANTEHSLQYNMSDVDFSLGARSLTISERKLQLQLFLTDENKKPQQRHTAIPLKLITIMLEVEDI